MKRWVVTIIYLLATFRAATYGQNTPDGVTPSPGATYASLTSEQKALVDDWIKRFSATIRKPVDPQKAYDNLPVSSKTTFLAVTHALVSTQLTDEAGGNLGPAIQIIDKLDTVAGEVLGGKGDKQFRIYVQLKPGALDVLDKSREFRRMGDNTAYHKGYPVCYRSKPGPPSIQVSATTDQKRADVDVDYRSSGFPKGLVNGHLSSSNSDVRAGNNDETHNQRWLGLNNWWRSLLSAPQPAESQSAGFMETGRTAAEPLARAHMKPADAVFDMLNTWLVKRDVENVMSYFSDQSFPCANLELADADRGMAKFKIFMALQRANGRFGNVASLGDISTAVTLKESGERSKFVRQPHQEQFALYEVREDAAERFKCLNRLDATHTSSKAAASKSFGKYYGAVFRLGRKGEAEQTVLATLWAREVNSWKLISYDVDPVWDKFRTPDAATSAPASAPTVYAHAPPKLARASTEFLQTWLVKRNVNKALDYISEQCIECVKLNSNGEQPPKTAEEARAQLKRAMQKVLDTTGMVNQLEQAAVAAQPNHADLKLVKHENSRAFALVSLPDYMASAMDCKKRTAGEPVSFEAPSGQKTWGKYYATGLRLAKAGEDSGVLWAVWAQEGSDWKMVAYTVLTP